jgi:GT2 family glycosyltransferase
MKNKKIYVAVLNQGDIRIELAAVLHDLPFQGKYDVFITYPNDKPISNNRNKIVADFLARKEYDYLLMIDDDVIPPKNILNLADFQKDIISALTFMYQQNAVVPLTLKRNKEGTYGVADFRGYEGLMEVDTVGTGCVMLSRKVLEAIKAPFNDVFDEDGIRKYGLDIAFGRRAKEKGFQPYLHLDYPCGHRVVLDLKEVYSSLIR